MLRLSIVPLFALCLSAAMLTGCNQVVVTSSQLIGAPTYPPSDPSTIQIIRQKPTRPYESLAEIFVEPQGGNPPTPQIEAALQQKAAKYGADAVWVTSDKTVKSGTNYTGGGDFETTYGIAVRAVAIKFKK